jgi:hypothetical protein
VEPARRADAHAADRARPDAAGARQHDEVVAAGEAVVLRGVEPEQDGAGAGARAA